jgi:hypothetical protein
MGSVGRRTAMSDKVDFKDMVRIDKRKDGMLSFVLDGNFLLSLTPEQIEELSRFIDQQERHPCTRAA